MTRAVNTYLTTLVFVYYGSSPLYINIPTSWMPGNIKKNRQKVFLDMLRAGFFEIPILSPACIRGLVPAGMGQRLPDAEKAGRTGPVQQKYLSPAENFHQKEHTKSPFLCFQVVEWPPI